MGRKKNRSKKFVPEAPKRYANFAHCDKCEQEQQVSRVKLLGKVNRMAWRCKSCETILPFDRSAPSRLY